MCQVGSSRLLRSLDKSEIEFKCWEAYYSVSYNGHLIERTTGIKRGISWQIISVHLREEKYTKQSREIFNPLHT